MLDLIGRVQEGLTGLGGRTARSPGELALTLQDLQLELQAFAGAGVAEGREPVVQGR